jgi:predicted SnoaL-like aldol condensation-catalyzing enzyme
MMNSSSENENRVLALRAFDLLFNKRDFAAAEKLFSPDYIQHSARVPPGREGLFDLVKNVRTTVLYENQLAVASEEYVMLHGRLSKRGPGEPNWVVVDILRLENGLIVEHWDVIQQEATREQSKSGRPMFGNEFPSPG